MRPTDAGQIGMTNALESTLLAEARIYLGSLPASEAMFIRINTGVFKALWSEGVIRSAPNGTPDLLGIYRGWPTAIETKSKRGRQSQEQRDFQAAWERAGGIYLMPRTMAELKEGLAAISSLSQCADPSPAPTISR